MLITFFKIVAIPAYLVMMKAIVDNLKLKIDTLFDVKIGMEQNEELLDKIDFCAANRLYQMSGEAYKVINDIFFKLLPDEMPWGCQNVFTLNINFSNPNFYAALDHALNTRYEIKQVNLDIQRLNEITDDIYSSYYALFAA